MTRSAPERVVLYFDGASRGNPGPASFGVYSAAGVARSEAIGRATNNEAEWRGFLAALEEAIALGVRDVEIRADSELVLKQFRGEYRVKAPHLAKFLVEARRRAAHLPGLVVTHVPRSLNRHADRLANEALDAKRIGPEPGPSGAGEKGGAGGSPAVRNDPPA